MSTRSIIAASAIAFFTASSAFADPAQVPSQAYSWEGGYVGLNLGYGGGKAKHPFKYTDSFYGYSERESVDVTSSGFSGGIQAGWNFQYDSIVYGLEADIQASNVKGDLKYRYSDSFGDDFTVKAGTKMKRFGTIRARVGHTVSDQFLVYGTAGFAAGQTESNASIEGIGSDKIKKVKGGWTAGVGAEYAFDDSWSLKSEYIYTDLGKAKLFSYSDGSETISGSRKFSFHMFRVGVNFQF